MADFNFFVSEMLKKGGSIDLNSIKEKTAETTQETDGVSVFSAADSEGAEQATNANNSDNSVFNGNAPKAEAKNDASDDYALLLENIDLLNAMDADADGILTSEEYNAYADKTPESYGNYTSGRDFANDKSTVLSRDEYPQGWKPLENAYEYQDEQGTSYTKMSPEFLQYYIKDLKLGEQSLDGTIYDKEGNSVGVAMKNSDGSTSFFFLTSNIDEINDNRKAKVSVADLFKNSAAKEEEKEKLEPKSKQEFLEAKGYKFENGVIKDKEGNEIGTYSGDKSDLKITWTVGENAGKTEESTATVTDGNMTEKTNTTKDAQGEVESYSKTSFGGDGTKTVVDITRNAEGKFVRVVTKYNEDGSVSNTSEEEQFDDFEGAFAGTGGQE